MTDGEVLGPMTFSVPNWDTCDVIYRGDKPNLRVVDHLPSDDPEHHFTILVVEPE